MILVKENLNIDWPLVMAGLDNISGIISKNLDYFGNKISLEVPDDWTGEGELDSLISTNTIVDTSSEIVVSQISIFSRKNIQEFKRKIKKQSFKNKINFYSINTKEGENGTLILNVSENWSSQDTTDLDSLLDSLLGYDVVAESMDDYSERMKKGLAFYNEERAVLVQRMKDGEFTDIQLKEEIDEPLFRAKVDLILGDLKSAYAHVEEVPTAGVFTTEIKNSFLSGIGAMIAESYTE